MKKEQIVEPEDNSNENQLLERARKTEPRVTHTSTSAFARVRVHGEAERFAKSARSPALWVDKYKPKTINDLAVEQSS